MEWNDDIPNLIGKNPAFKYVHVSTLVDQEEIWSSQYEIVCKELAKLKQIEKKMDKQRR